MKYQDGREIRMGDHVRLSNNEGGVVVFSIDTNEFSDEYPRSEWGYLEEGIMVRTDAGALIHYKENSGEVLIRENGGVRT